MFSGFLWHEKGNMHQTLLYAYWNYSYFMLGRTCFSCASEKIFLPLPSFWIRESQTFPFLVAWNRVTLFLAWCTTVDSYLQPKFLYPWGRRQFIAFCTSWCCCGLLFYWVQTNRNYHKNKGWALTDVCWFQEVFLLSSNSAKTRQAALESLKSAFSSKILYEFIMERRMTLTDSIERCIKKGN